MVERYTSPETSRALAEAGLERRIRSYGAYYVENELRRTQFELSVGPSFFAVRALDLTDCIHELTRPRPEEKDARPLCETWFLYPSWVLTIGEEDGGVRKYILPWRLEGYEFSVGDHGKPTSRQALADSPVEAAALVLLALLKERSNDKAS